MTVNEYRLASVGSDHAAAHGDLKALAHRVRRRVVRLATDGGCFIGASLSCVDLLAYLYTHWLKVDQQRLDDPDRDYLLLSKGHDVPALYGLLAELGWLDPSRLQRHLKVDDDIYWHPNRRIPGVEFHSGSLGHLLSVGLGIALDIRLRGGTGRVVVVLGDGELNEGSIWESVLVAAAKGLENLVAVVDRNGFQANVATEELLPLEPLTDKFATFGWHARRVDGHDFSALAECFDTVPVGCGRPTVVIADTVRGKGLPSIEARADRWFCNFSADEVTQLLGELDGTRSAEITSEVLLVR
ncbi:transketolase [Methylotetracoccus oryzae]|uniref:transketolase n=1 Tax=Methylotetracoccus oryzae TaxID=1919059 RepID=UPI001118CC99|nr:thiamine pyrophosphate-dependent enzyme [Methylotetracoccus oryzae]